MAESERLKKDAYMILGGMAFTFEVRNNKSFVIASSIKNPAYKVVMEKHDNHIHLSSSNMSNENTYKALLIAERNKVFLMEGLAKCQNTH